MPLRITSRITTRSGAALMKSISRAAVSQAVNLMIGSGPSANSERSLFSHKTGIVLSSIAAILETEIEIQRAENNGKEKPRRQRLRTHNDHARTKNPSNLASAGSFARDISKTKGEDSELRLRLSLWPRIATAPWRQSGSRRRSQHSCFGLQPRPSNRSAASAGGRSGHRRNARCPDLWRMGSDFGRLRQRRDSTAGIRLHHQAKLQRGVAGSRRPGSFRNRSKTLSSDVRSRQG